MMILIADTIICNYNGALTGEISDTIIGYVKNSIARPIPLRSINEKNWIEVANDYRRCFILEKQFRKFYVDYLIREIGDQKKFFTECRCQRQSMNDSFMDYVMLFDGKYLPVETKLSVAAEPNIVNQVSKYVYKPTHKSNEPKDKSNEPTHKINEPKKNPTNPSFAGIG